jgi:hypothetical protein
MTPHTFTGHEIELSNGNQFDPSQPDHRTIDLDTIATALSNLTRFGGHTEFYSVAEHAVLVAAKLGRLGAPVSLRMAGLHHDDAEALDGFGDIQRPAKSLLDGAYRERFRKIDRCVWRALAWPDKDREPLWQTAQLHDDLLKRVDVWAVLLEARRLMRSGGQGWEQTVDGEYESAVAIPAHVEDVIVCWSPLFARRAYLGLHRRLVAESYGRDPVAV